MHFQGAETVKLGYISKELKSMMANKQPQNDPCAVQGEPGVCEGLAVRDTKTFASGKKDSPQEAMYWLDDRAGGLLFMAESGQRGKSRQHA